MSTYSSNVMMTFPYSYSQRSPGKNNHPTSGSHSSSRGAIGSAQRGDTHYQQLDNGSEAESLSPSKAQGKKNMKRHRLTHDETRFLLNEFARDPHPDNTQRERLARSVKNLTVRQVQVWFQNRRAKLKRMSEEDAERVLASRRYPPTHGPVGMPRSDGCASAMGVPEARTEAVFAASHSSVPSLRHTLSSSPASNASYSPHHMKTSFGVRRLYCDAMSSRTASPMSHDDSIGFSDYSDFKQSSNAYPDDAYGQSPVVGDRALLGASTSACRVAPRSMAPPSAPTAEAPNAQILPRPASLADISARGWHKSWSLENLCPTQTQTQSNTSQTSPSTRSRQTLPSISHELFAFLTAGTNLAEGASEGKPIPEGQPDFATMVDLLEQQYCSRGDSLTKDPFTARLSLSFDSRQV